MAAPRSLQGTSWKSTTPVDAPRRRSSGDRAARRTDVQARRDAHAAHVGARGVVDAGDGRAAGELAGRLVPQLRGRDLAVLGAEHDVGADAGTAHAGVPEGAR